jgi:hypothetical protein
LSPNKSEPVLCAPAAGDRDSRWDGNELDTIVHELASIGAGLEAWSFFKTSSDVLLWKSAAFATGNGPSTISNESAAVGNAFTSLVDDGLRGGHRYPDGTPLSWWEMLAIDTDCQEQRWPGIEFGGFDEGISRSGVEGVPVEGHKLTSIGTWIEDRENSKFSSVALSWAVVVMRPTGLELNSTDDREDASDHGLCNNKFIVESGKPLYSCMCKVGYLCVSLIGSASKVIDW